MFLPFRDQLSLEKVNKHTFIGSRSSKAPITLNGTQFTKFIRYIDRHNLWSHYMLSKKSPILEFQSRAIFLIFYFEFAEYGHEYYDYYKKDDSNIDEFRTLKIWKMVNFIKLQDSRNDIHIYSVFENRWHSQFPNLEYLDVNVYGINDVTVDLLGRLKGLAVDDMDAEYIDCLPNNTLESLHCDYEHLKKLIEENKTSNLKEMCLSEVHGCCFDDKVMLSC